MPDIRTFAIAYFHGHFRPESDRENGHSHSLEISLDNPGLRGIDERLILPVHERSGWPVFLAQFAREAHRRLESGELSSFDYYCSDIFIKGCKVHKKGVA